ncbi:hypothetical protein F3Y22_tig00018093pilonHSYRG00018 [Hibiscus syriacus]|uniref:RRM domain-containing protein n=1 Tax=Hibiscus syriacus TaxID=106335 RepID=A0A6A3BVF2_HIBSY|nr:hypothetical protein F3Y22_tig00018093pilonHSYRG00018 [Hibiscus syriacus]
MPRRNEPEQPVESDERVDLKEVNDPEETMEEEVEYEEVEVEEEEEIEEEMEEEDQDVENADGEFDEDEKKTRAELLARPPHGSEVYIGGIPHDVSQEDLKGFCESVGEVTEVRIMKGKNSSENKGFAFVTFRRVALANNAMDELNNVEFKGKKIRCSNSQSKHRLFIGNIPRSWGEEYLRNVVSKVGPGVTGLELVKDIKNSSNNRGFAFVEYYNNACAEYSRQKMMNPEFRLGDNAPTVSWADPKNSESSAASQVKLWNVLLQSHKQIKRHRGGSNSQNSGFLPSYPPQVGYGLVGGAYGALGPGYGVAGLPQPLIYGRGATTTGMSMMPMLLPDGRIGYVLQQPGAQQPQSPPVHQRHSRGGGSSSSRGKHCGSDSGRRYRPY